MNEQEYPGITQTGKAVKIALALTFMIFVVVLIRTAWISDDSYITLRTVDNFVRDYGLRWNICERVQTYTHPLWMFLLTVFYFFTHEAYFTAIIVSLIVSALAFYILAYKISFSPPAAFIGALVLIVSKAFVDYSTSGMENALSHLIFVLFIYIYLKYEFNYKNFCVLSLFAALGALNRLDHILIFAPPLLYAAWRVLKAKSGTRAVKDAIIALAIGFSPMILWEIFSIIYYGFPFPNTAYAKLNTGIASVELIRQGLLYFRDSLIMDPVTLIAILSAVAMSFVAKNFRVRFISVGVLLYFTYILKIGGDFMSGRFFTAPLICSAAVLASSRYTPPRFIAGLLIVLSLGLFPKHSPVKSGTDYSNREFNMSAGIADERGFYYPKTGLLVSDGGKKIANHPWVQEMRIEKRRAVPGRKIVARAYNAGFAGYFAGNDMHIVDPCALCDPFLAMLPANGRFTGVWRIGHFIRDIPAGYMETLRTGKNVIWDQDYAEFYDKLLIVISGPVFSFTRFAEIWNINTGKYKHLLSKKIISPASFKSRTGERIEDNSSCNGFVFRAVPGMQSPGLLACGPGLRLYTGNYSAGFRLKANKPVPEEIVKLEITSDKGERLLASASVHGSYWRNGSEWKLYEVPFRVKGRRARNVEFRVYYTGNAELSFDFAILRYDL